MNRVFLSFRKVDDRVTREQVDQRLCTEFGREQVFKSGESIPAGTDYVATLQAQATACSVMLVLIGGAWLTASDARGGALIERDDDWVRVEIRTALAAGNRVVPVLLGERTLLPTAAELPDDLAALADLQALRIAHSAVDAGLDQLVAELKRMLPRLAPDGNAAPDPAPMPAPMPAQNVTISGGGSGVVANGPVSGTVAGRDIRGNVVQGDHNETTVKAGGATSAAAALVAAAVAGSRGLVAKAADWSGAHKATAIISVLVVVGGAGLGTAVAVGGRSGDPQAQAGNVAAATVAASPGTSAAPAPSPSPSPGPTVTSGGTLTNSLSDSTGGSWSDGRVLAVETPVGSPTYFDTLPTHFQITSYAIATGRRLGTYVPDGVDDGCIDGLVHNGNGDDVLLSQDIDTVPAQGLTGGGTFLRIEGIDASTGSTLWTAMLPAVTNDSTELCTTGYAYTSSLGFTPDGRFALEKESGTGDGDTDLLNLETGAITKEVAGTGLAGDWLSEPNDPSSPTRVSIVDPATGAVADTLTGTTAADFVDVSAYDDSRTTSGDYGHDVAGDLDFISFSSNQHSEAVAYSLPSGAIAWTSPSGNALDGLQDVGTDPETHATFAYFTGGYSGSGALARFDPATGHVLWKLTGPVFCGATDGHVYVEANSELVQLNEATGVQISYNTQIKACPSVEDGVIDEAVRTDAGGAGPYYAHSFVAG